MIDPTQQQGVPLTGPAGQGLGSQPAAMPPAAPAALPPGMPAGLVQPPRRPSVPPTALSHITPETPPERLPKEPNLDDLQNSFERRGLLLAQAIEEQGRRISDAMQQPPTGATKLAPEQIRDYFRYSPNGTDEVANNEAFWQIHDQVLVQTGDPAQAEQQALQQVYPYRAMLIGTPDDPSIGFFTPRE